MCPWAATRPLLYILFRNSAIAVAIAGAEILAGVQLKGLYSIDSTLKLFKDFNRIIQSQVQHAV